MAAAHACVCARDRIAIAVFNYAGAPRSVIAPAVETARMAFRAAGIETIWTICDPEHCAPAPPADGRNLDLLVMPRLRGALPGGSDRAHPAGYAMTGGPFLRPRAYAFYDAVKSVADRTNRPMSLVLGCVLVHETAHLLGLQHRTHGAMRANLDAQDMDDVAVGRAFDAEEGRRLRAAVDGYPTLRAGACP
jgi:hypothetical protein